MRNSTLSQSGALFNFISTHPHFHSDSHQKPRRLSRVPRLFSRNKAGEEAAAAADKGLVFYNAIGQDEM